MINMRVCVIATVFLAKSTVQEGCKPPESLINGSMEFNGTKNIYGKYDNGVQVNYICRTGYVLRPSNIQSRICKNGQWTGVSQYCVQTVSGCPPPEPIANGYYETRGPFNKDFKQREEVIPKCDEDFVLVGPPILRCMTHGSWYPRKKTPYCSPQYNVNNNVMPEVSSCPIMRNVSNALVKLFYGKRQNNDVSSNVVLEIKCLYGYRDVKNPCVPSYVHCENGVWKGDIPICVEATNCIPPLDIPHVIIMKESYSDEYPISSEISYVCEHHYVMENDGATRFRCSESGCWLPNVNPPVCRASTHFSYGIPYEEEPRISTTEMLMCVVLVVTSISLIVLAVCFLNICRQRYQSYHHGGGLCRNANSLLHSAAVNPIVQNSTRRSNMFSFSNGSQTNDVRYLPTYEEVMQQDALTDSVVRGSFARTNDENTSTNFEFVNPTRGTCTRFSPCRISMVICSETLPQHLLTTANSQTEHNDSGETGRNGTDITTISDTSNFETTPDNASSQDIYSSLGSLETSSVTNSEGFPLLPDHNGVDTCSRERVVSDK